MEQQIKINIGFFNPKLQLKINKTIDFILKGVNVTQNQQILKQLRKDPQYVIMLCNILSDTSQDSSMVNNQINNNKKLFYLLEIKKKIQQLEKQQCWWIFKSLYYHDNKKIAQFIRQLAVLYQRVENSTGKQYLGILLNVDFQKVGIAGVVRFLQLISDLITSNTNHNQLQNYFLNKYCSIISLKLQSLIQLQLQYDFIHQFALVILLQILKFTNSGHMHFKTQNWDDILSQFCTKTHDSLIYSKDKSYLKLFLFKLFYSQIINSNYVLEQQNTIQITNSLAYCLKQLQNVNLILNSQKKIYIHALQLLDCFIANILQNQLNQNIKQRLLSDIISIYSNYTQVQLKAFIQLTGDQQAQQQQQSVKFCILRTVLQKCDPFLLKTIISKNSQFTIKMMQFSLFLPSINQNTHLIDPNQFQSYLDKLNESLMNQVDTYLFVEQMKKIIWIMLKYITKFGRYFEKDLILKICYVIDFLAYKCDSISSQCYDLLQLIIEQIMDIQGYKLADFFQKSLSNINQNSQWLQSHRCYFHIIKIITHISPQFIFDKNLKRSNFYKLNSIENQILIMIKKMIQNLSKQFNFQQIHKLNDFLLYLSQNQAQNIYRHLRYDYISKLIQLNYNYQVYTEASSSIYLYFCQFYQDKTNFINSLDLYQFWDKCQSQKLYYFVTIYLKIVDSNQKYFTSSEQQAKLINLKKNLWHRYVSQRNTDKRKRILDVFTKHKKYFYDLLIQCEKSKSRSQSFSQSEQQKFYNYEIPKMQIQ